jgi:hypothetical protein
MVIRHPTELALGALALALAEQMKFWTIERVFIVSPLRAGVSPAQVALVAALVSVSFARKL